jgi:photosystem I reaction center subunit XII
VLRFLGFIAFKALLTLETFSNFSGIKLCSILVKDFFMISESQIFIALFVALVNGVLAVRLGSKLYQ